MFFHNYRDADHIASESAKTSVNKDLAFRSWVASHGGVYVPVTSTTQPNVYLAKIKDRDFFVHNRHYTLMNPAYTLSEMMKEYTNLYGVKTHITSRNLLNPANAPDTWETKALEKVELTRGQYGEVSTIEGEKYFRLMNPLFVKKSCLKCHGDQGYQIGDIRGGVSVSIPLKDLYADAKEHNILTLLALLLIWLFGMVGIYFFKKRVVHYIDEREHFYEEYIYGLVNVVEKRDTYTAGHSQRVAKYAKLIADKMDFDESEKNLLYRAGMLHDIGKIAIPDSVFLKPSKLTNDEYHIIQEHVTMSYEILKDISIFDDIKEIVRSHHEHYDGSGYPLGKKGDEIPMLSQILMLADSFDAMTTHRIYKGRKSLQEALDEIKKLSSKQFNPLVATAALQALQDINIDEVQAQKPVTTLEKERFSYFYKDTLCSVFNDVYFESQLIHLQEYRGILWISLKHFHQYNKQEGWKKGNQILINSASTLKDFFSSNSPIYRVNGDNFFVMYKDPIDILSIQYAFEDILSESNIDFELKQKEPLELDGLEIKEFQDVVEKLF